MSDLRKAMEEYLKLRRSLGFELLKVAGILRSFVAFAEKETAFHITTDLVIRWVKLSTAKESATLADKYNTVRRFAIWRNAIDVHTEVPPKGLLPGHYHRKPPYIYSDEEIERLVREARNLPSLMGVRGLTYATLFGLLAATGMRISEALALNREDVDFEEGVLDIQQSKFRKSRLVPLHRSTCDVLEDYTKKRNQIFPRLKIAAFFVSEGGTRVTQWAARDNFAKVSREIGIRAKTESRRLGRGPRLHDMRHRFAARTLVDWYRAGVDVEREIHKLSTYLGHVHVNDTYWYLEAVPELLALATQRLMDRTKEVD
ncbi:MAG: tyrosine-type recombinase/integrase [Proteobacteria bacterium]|nr:tyrosine-type recombinase/integrase [Pseudomonadota bacterium]MBU1650545.1 tyrosine-type recombinase/integrase [Pseudomonadota bacterium]MBU1987088.1 tyrosine-type recombinase/integrase [Pseudomonadota bacterium]